jgi:hypothetical protein
VSWATSISPTSVPFSLKTNSSPNFDPSHMKLWMNSNWLFLPVTWCSWTQASTLRRMRAA